MKIGMVGGGNMARAILRATLAKGFVQPDQIYLSDVKPEALEYARQKFGVHTSQSNQNIIDNCEVIILAIKPQNLPELAGEVSGKFNRQQLIISVLAGITMGKLQGSLEHRAVVRAMPNTPALIGMGMTVWTASAEVNDEGKQVAGSIFKAMGRELYTQDESFIDTATAVSGGGPAYFFLFMECLAKAAVSLGCSPEVALTLVRQTALGSVSYAIQSGTSLEELRRQVTSPGGTTAEALKVFEQAGFSSTVELAVKQAFIRAGEIGRS